MSTMVVEIFNAKVTYSVKQLTIGWCAKMGVSVIQMQAATMVIFL